MAMMARCRGKKSIQLEIMRRIKEEMGDDWMKALRDSDLKETYRLEIIEEGDEWCDAKAGTCVCEKIAKENANIALWSDMFPGKSIK